MRSVLLAALLLALPRPAAAQAPDTAPLPRVVEVRFAGVAALDVRLLETSVATREPPCRGSVLGACLGGREPAALLDTVQLRRDEERVRALYDAWGYPEASVRAEAVPAGDGEVEVVFRVAEGAPLVVRSVGVRGVEAVPGARLPELPLRAGEPYALPRLEAAQRLIAGVLAERGYAFAQVEVSGEVSREARTADVVLTAVPGRRATFGSTTFRVERPLTEEVVGRRLAFRPGDAFSTSALERTQERLYALPVVDTATVELAPEAGSDSVVATRVTVSAGRVRAVQGDGTFSSSSCLEGRAWWASRHFLGEPRVVSLTAGASNLLARQLPGLCAGGGDDEGGLADPDFFVRTEWREPVGGRTWLLLELEASRETAQRAYVRRGVRARVGLSREMARGVEGVAAFAPERSDYAGSAYFFCGVHGVCGGARLEELTGAATLAPVELALGWTSPAARGAVPGPRTGPEWLRALEPGWLSTARLALSGAGTPTGSEIGFLRADARGSLTRFLGSRGELAVRARAGLLAGGDEALPPSLRLYGGGPLGVRGVAANLLGPKLLLARTADSAALGCAPRAGGCEGARIDPGRVRLRPAGGEALLEATLEGRVWVGPALQLAGFVDFGAVRSGGEGAGSESVVTPGIGARLLRPFPFRLDLAYDPSPARRYPLLLREDDGAGYVPLGEVVYDPYEGRGFRRRLRVQLSAGTTF